MFDLNGNFVMIFLKTYGNCYVVSQKAHFFSFLMRESSKIDFVDYYSKSTLL